jgi:hypothetical protein
MTDGQPGVAGLSLTSSASEALDVIRDALAYRREKEPKK